MPRRSDARKRGSPLIGRIVGDGLELVELMHDGGLSVVYRAAGRDGRAAVIKLPAAIYAHLPSLRRRFEREAELAQRLDGRGAPRLVGMGTLDGRPYVALELVAGELLERRLARRRPAGLRPGEAVKVAGWVLAALGHVHALGVLHGDVKPSNVMLLVGGGAKLLDLGVASSATGEAGGADDDDGDGDDFGAGGFDPFDGSGVPLGTPAYAAPERIAGGPIDERADVYTVGVVLFEMLAGRRPFRGDPVEVLEAHLREPPPPLRELVPACSEALAGVVARALAKEPAGRFADVAALAAALAAVPEARVRRRARR